MPELPEVQTTVSGLKSKVLNRTFVDVWTDTEKLFKNMSFGDFRKEIKNKKIKDIRRRGKNLIFELSEEYFLLVHLKMTGHFLYDECPPAGGQGQEDSMNRFIRARFFLDNDKVLALSDLRKFAKIELLKKEELDKELELLGPEPLEKDFTFEKFKKVLKKGKIKQILMNQNIFVGVGNIYADEILWQAEVHPEKNVLDLSEKELKKIYLATKDILLEALKFGGTSTSDYRNIEGGRGTFEKKLKAYQRQGQKCFRCGTIIKRKKIAQRGTHFCPTCQKL